MSFTGEAAGGVKGSNGYIFTVWMLTVCRSAAVESTGAAKAEAQSRAEAARIQGEAAVNEAKLKAEAQRIEAVCSDFLFLCRLSK